MAELVAKQDVAQNRDDLSKMPKEDAVKEILRCLHTYDKVTEPKGAAPKQGHIDGDARYKIHRCHDWEYTRLLGLFEAGLSNTVHVPLPNPEGRSEFLDDYNEDDYEGHEEPRDADSPVASSASSVPTGPQEYSFRDLMQLDTESTKVSQANPLFSCFICNKLDHNSGNCGTAGIIFDDHLLQLAQRQTKNGDPKAPKATQVEWTKHESQNDFNRQTETVEEYYLRCSAKPKEEGHVLDADFILAIARLSDRLGLLNPET
jgi:hypothetical protein